MISIAIIGYGKMGKQIESILDKNEFNLTGTFDMDDDISSAVPTGTNVAIEFTSPKSVIKNIELLSSCGINIVCGTTGWYDKADEVKKIIEKNGTGFIYGSNFSVGVNIFFNIIKHAASIIEKYEQYAVSIEETHHTQKLDKPSGTAIRIAEYLLNDISRKKSITSDKINAAHDELNIISKRIENVVGNHKVIFDSMADTITLEHNAKSRRGFAEGALLAAKFINGKKGFFKFEEIFDKII